MDSVTGRNAFDLLHPLRCDESSSLGERLESAFQGEHHAFHDASLAHIRKWMTMQHAVNVRVEAHSSERLAKPSEEHPAILQHLVWPGGFRVAPVTDDSRGARAAPKP